MLHSNIIGEGKPLLIIHGLFGMSDNWKTLGTRFGAQGFRVHLIDMRNHGKSFHSDVFDYEAMADDVFRYCQLNDLEKISIIGHSMGGKAIMFFAATYPEIITKMIVADIGPKYYAPHHQTILKALNAVDFSAITTRNEVEEVLKKYISDFGTLQFLLKNLFWKSPNQLAFRFNLETITDKISNVGAALPENVVVNLQTLFLRGGNSDYIQEDDYQSIQKQFPNSQFETISNVGHWLHAENPDLFFEISNRFLN